MGIWLEFEIEKEYCAEERNMLTKHLSIIGYHLAVCRMIRSSLRYTYTNTVTMRVRLYISQMFLEELLRFSVAQPTD